MFGKSKKTEKDMHTTAEEAQKHIKRMHDEIVDRMDIEDKAMYALLKVQGDLENMMQFGYHIGTKQTVEKLSELAKKIK